MEGTTKIDAFKKMLIKTFKSYWPQKLEQISEQSKDKRWLANLYYQVHKKSYWSCLDEHDALVALVHDGYLSNS